MSESCTNFTYIFPFRTDSRFSLKISFYAYKPETSIILHMQNISGCDASVRESMETWQEAYGRTEANLVCIGSDWHLLLNDRLALNMMLLHGQTLERSMRIQILLKPGEFQFDKPSLLLGQDCLNELRQLLPIAFKFNELRYFIQPQHTWKLTRAVMLTEELKFDFAESDICAYVHFGDRRVTIRDTTRTCAILRLDLHQWREILAHESAHKLTNADKCLRFGQVVVGEVKLTNMYSMRFSDRFGNELRTKLAIRPCYDQTREEGAPSRLQMEADIDSDAIYMCQTHAWTGLLRLLEFLLEFIRYDETERSLCKNRVRRYAANNDD